MGINLNELSGLAGGGVEGFSKASADRISRNQENRAQTQENERRGAYEITEALKGKMSELAGLLDPSQQAQAGYIPPAGAQAGTPPGAIPTAPPQGGGAPPAGVQTSPMAPPAGPAPGAPTQGAGTGMFGDDLPPTQGGALPAESPQGGGKEMALSEMQVPGDADTAGPRNKLQQWKTETMAMAGRAGGIQAMKAVEDYYQMATQGQMYQYATEGIRALADGSAGTAAKMLNTAMEIAPVDPEIEFFAMNGELYAQRGDGEPVRYKQEDLIGLTEQYLMNPDNYMEWQKQMLEERRADIAARATAVQEGYLDIAEEKLPADLSKTGAEIYALLKNADSRAAAVEADSTPGLTPSLIRNINNDIPTLIQNAKVDPGSQWWGAMVQNPAVATGMQSAAIDIAKRNLMGEGNYADAIGLAAFAFAPAAGIETPKDANIGGIGRTETGQPYAIWNGKPLQIPLQAYLALAAQAGIEVEGAKPVLQDQSE